MIFPVRHPLGGEYYIPVVIPIIDIDKVVIKPYDWVDENGQYFRAYLFYYYFADRIVIAYVANRSAASLLLHALHAEGVEVEVEVEELDHLPEELARELALRWLQLQPRFEPTVLEELERLKMGGVNQKLYHKLYVGYSEYDCHVYGNAGNMWVVFPSDSTLDSYLVLPYGSRGFGGDVCAVAAGVGEPPPLKEVVRFYKALDAFHSLLL